MNPGISRVSNDSGQQYKCLTACPAILPSKNFLKTKPSHTGDNNDDILLCMRSSVASGVQHAMRTTPLHSAPIGPHEKPPLISTAALLRANLHPFACGCG
jgi:hypothetical protein